MKLSKVVKIWIAIIWVLYFIIGIAKNYTHYELLDWIIILSVALLPILLFTLLRRRKTSIDATTESITDLSNLPSNDMPSETITVDVQGDTFLSSQDEAYLNTLLPNGKTIREQQQIDFQLHMGIYPSGTPSFCGMKIVSNTIPPMENFHVLNEDEQKFFRYFHAELVKNKFKPELIKLSRLSNGCFNVDYIGLCYIGKINLFQPPITYSVKKEGNKRATKTFSSLSEAEEFIQGKNDYSIIPCQENYSFFIQYTQGSRDAKNIRVTSVEECIMYIPYWIRYLKYCKRN